MDGAWDGVPSITATIIDPFYLPGVQSRGKEVPRLLYSLQLIPVCSCSTVLIAQKQGQQ